MVAKYKVTTHSETIDRILINETNEVHIDLVLNEENEAVGIDIRQWYFPNGEDECRPTQKGIRIDAANVDTLLNAIISAKESFK